MAYSLRQLIYAVAVAEHGSITQAANKIGISQPAISAGVTGLEEEFGISLFLRQPAKRVTLSPAGKHFIAHAQHLLEHVDEFESKARGLGHRLEGSIQVGCFFPTAPFIMPLILREMDERYPGIKVQFQEGNLQELISGVKTGNIETALVYDLHPDRNVQFESLIEAHPYVLLSANDPLAQKKSVHLKDLHDKEMVVFELPITQEYFQNIVAIGGVPPNIGYRTKSYELVRSLVAARMGYSILILTPHTNRAYDGTELVTRSIADPVPPARYGLIMSKDYVPRGIVQAFIDVCRTTLKENNAADQFLHHQ